MSKFISPYTDFGFKKLFGEEASKDLLIDFLNQLLPEKHQIAELTFKNSENLPDLIDDRRAIFDISCVSQTGERFVVEMQKAKVHFFKDRALFYSTFPIRDQAEKGNWNFKLNTVYFVAILDFICDEKEEIQKFRRDVALKDQDGDVFYDKLHFRFLQMPLFNKTESELETHFDKWIYFLKHLEDLDEIPAILNEPIFRKGFDITARAKLTHEEHEQYLLSWLRYNELQSALDTALEDGEAKGFERGFERGIKRGIERGIEKGVEQGKIAERIEFARKLKQKGLSNVEIAELTGLTIEEIGNL